MTTVYNSYQTNLQRTLDRYYRNKRNLEAAQAPIDPDNRAPPRNVRNFQQRIQDVAVDTLQNARDIGTLIKGKTRINVTSALTTNDLFDFYKFTTSKDGKLTASVSTDKGVRLQILQRNGTIIADSEASFGEKADNFAKLATGLDLKKGDYYLKVTRQTGADRSERPNYAIQLSQSRYYEEDYDTVETPPPRYNTKTASLIKSSNISALSTTLNQLSGGTLFDKLY